MGDEGPWTIKRLLEWTTGYLSRHGAESPRLDAELLLAHALSVSRIQLYTRYDEIPVEPQLGNFREGVRRRSTGMPVAYLLGRKEFFSLEFQVTPAVLIPRPETELVVVAVLDALKSMSAESTLRRIIDLGTGSGAIAIAVAKQAVRVEVLAVDGSADALQVAKNNVQTHGVDDRISLRRTNWLEGIEERGTWDVIVSNPPYIGLDERESLSTEVKDHEPSAALFSGTDGTDATRRIIDESWRWLRPGGYLILETSPIIGPQMLEHLKQHSAYADVVDHKDGANRLRILQARRNGED